MLFSSSDNHKQNCEFAEESVAYLYGEMDESQSGKFSLHLEKCSNCAEEIKAFSSIHSSIQNWKAEKFAPLATPVIEIPSDWRQKSGAEATISSFWLRNLRERFSFSSGLVQAGAFAALLICLAFGLFFLMPSNNKELTSERTDKKFATEITTNSANEVTEIKELDSGSQNIGDSGKSESIKSGDLLTNVRADEKILATKKSAPTKVSKIRKMSEGKEKTPKQLLNRKTGAPEIYADAAPGNNRNLPKLNNLPEEAEDEDLRLADLFEEIDEG